MTHATMSRNPVGGTGAPVRYPAKYAGDRRLQQLRIAVPFVAGCALWIWDTGCARITQETADQPTQRVATRPATRPAEAPDDGNASSAPAAASAPTTTSAPATQPEGPPLPEYLEIRSRVHDGKAALVRSQILSGGRLVIDTDNVTRLRIRRELLDLPTRRSVILRLDGQVIEWTAGSPVSEFERSSNGVWMPVRGR